MALRLLGRSETLALLDISLEKTLDGAGLFQLGLQARQHAALDLLQVECSAVGASAALAHPRAVDAPALCVAVLRHQRAATAPAAQQAGKQTAGLAPGGGRPEVAALLHPGLGRGKCLGLDDPQVRYRRGLPLGFRVQARHPLAGPGILAQRNQISDLWRKGQMAADAKPIDETADRAGDGEPHLGSVLS